MSWAEVSLTVEPRINGLEAVVELAMQRQRVRTAVAELPEEQKQVLVLAYFGGHTHREIAEMLNQPLGIVKMRIRLAMQKLRETLQDERPP